MVVVNLEKLTRKELEWEYNLTRQQIDEGSFGSHELKYQDYLENEIARRGLEAIQNRPAYKLVKS